MTFTATSRWTGAGHDAWLNRTIEAPLDPELPVCDAHHHLWDRPGDRYVVEDLLADAKSGHRVTSTVFVEVTSFYRKDVPTAMQPVGEVESVYWLATRKMKAPGAPDVAAGIVGYADLRLGAGVVPVLEAEMAAGRERFKGIRNSSAWDASTAVPNDYRMTPPGLLLDPRLREGFAYLRRYDLTFDAFLYHPQLTDVADLARAFPDTPIILNHIGVPLGVGPYAGQRQEVFEVWNRGLRACAACPNVFLKLGGWGTAYFGFGWAEMSEPPGSAQVAASVRPYFDRCIELFGTDRCMFESNFPVDRQSYSYAVAWNICKRLASGFSAAEMTALFSGNAERVYRLGD